MNSETAKKAIVARLSFENMLMLAEKVCCKCTITNVKNVRVELKLFNKISIVVSVKFRSDSATVNLDYIDENDHCLNILLVFNICLRMLVK
jgi:hypothetical protein